MPPRPNCWACVVVLSTVCGHAPVATSGERDSEVIAGENVIEEFSISRAGDLLLLPIEIDGRTYKFALSSVGGEHTVDSVLYARRAFETGRREIDEQGFPLERYDFKGLLGKSRIPIEGPADCEDFSRMRKSTGLEFYGAVDMGFLKSQVIQIDFKIGKLRLLKEVPAGVGIELPLTFNEKGAPMLRARLSETESLSFQVALGDGQFTAGSLDPDTFNRLVADERLVVDKYRDGVATRGFLNRLEFGSLTDGNLHFAQRKKNQLGLGFLARYHVVFDFPNARMFLKPRDHVPKPVVKGYCGLELCRISNRTYVDSVDDNGPGQKAGLRADDRIIKINGIESQNMSLFELRMVLYARGNRSQLVFDRDRERLECELTAE